MYITNAELGMPEEQLIRLTDDEGSGMPDAARMDEAIESACGFIDAALGPRFATPLASPSGLVKSIARDLAVYNLYMRAGVVPEEVARSRDIAAAMLSKAEEGLLYLGLAPDMEGPGLACSDREFTREYMQGM